MHKLLILNSKFTRSIILSLFEYVNMRIGIYSLISVFSNSLRSFTLESSLLKNN